MWSFSCQYCTTTVLQRTTCTIGAFSTLELEIDNVVLYSKSYTEFAVSEKSAQDVPFLYYPRSTIATHFTRRQKSLAVRPSAASSERPVLIRFVKRTTITSQNEIGTLRGEHSAKAQSSPSTGPVAFVWPEDSILIVQCTDLFQCPYQTS